MTSSRISFARATPNALWLVSTWTIRPSPESMTNQRAMSRGSPGRADWSKRLAPNVIRGAAAEPKMPNSPSTRRLASAAIRSTRPPEVMSIGVRRFVSFAARNWSVATRCRASIMSL